MSDSIVAALVGLGGAVALELVRHALALGQNRAQRSLDDATSFRQDLLARIGALEDDCSALGKERDGWQGRYYAEREARIRAELQLEGQRPGVPPPSVPEGEHPSPNHPKEPLS